MKRRTFLLGALAAGTGACRRDRRSRLNVYNWSNYVAPDTIPNFEKESGVRVRYVTYESNEEMLAKVITATQVGTSCFRRTTGFRQWPPWACSRRSITAA